MVAGILLGQLASSSVSTISTDSEVPCASEESGGLDLERQWGGEGGLERGAPLSSPHGGILVRHSLTHPLRPSQCLYLWFLGGPQCPIGLTGPSPELQWCSGGSGDEPQILWGPQRGEKEENLLQGQGKLGCPGAEPRCCGGARMLGKGLGGARRLPCGEHVQGCIPECCSPTPPVRRPSPQALSPLGRGRGCSPGEENVPSCH